ncbi:MAG: DUF5103 domain-containing protein [Chlorobi bacterium]|nr:DUF5103 domain-containing protein [Chlorobiota bacterium]
MKIKNILLVLFFFASAAFAQDFEIKSLQVYVGNNQAAFPVVRQNGRLTIEFDIMTEEMPNLAIKFLFCDREWVPYENIFLNNSFRNIDYGLWFDQLPTTVKLADYHFKDTYPKRNEVEFNFSGKWIFQIVDSQNEDIVFAEGYFYVIIPEVNIDVGLAKKNIRQSGFSNSAMDKVYELTVNFSLHDNLFPENVLDVEVVQNHKMFFPYVLKRENTSLRFFEWNGTNKFLFGAQDIIPGNSYRQTNLLDRNRFIPPATNAQLDRIETSNFYVQPRRDFYGGEKLLNFNNEDAQYMDVKFWLREDNYDKDVFLVGAFNDWYPSPEYQMKNDDGLYTISIELKRGIYDYQYISGYDVKGEIVDLDWYYFEGNDWDRDNLFNVFVYYAAPEEGGYDKIIGFAKLTTKEYGKRKHRDNWDRSSR